MLYIILLRPAFAQKREIITKKGNYLFTAEHFIEQAHDDDNNNKNGKGMREKKKKNNTLTKLPIMFVDETEQKEK